MLGRLTVLLALALVLPAAAQARWSEPSAGGVGAQMFANNARGDRIAATFDPRDNSATVALARAGHGWGAPIKMPVLGTPSVAIGPRGDALVTVTGWDGSSDTCCDRVTAFRLTPAGQIAATMPVVPSERQVVAVTLAIRDASHFAVAYTYGALSAPATRLLVAAGGATLGPPVELGGSTPVEPTLGAKRSSLLARRPDGTPVERLIAGGGSIGDETVVGPAWTDPEGRPETVTAESDAEGRQVALVSTGAGDLAAAFRDPGKRFHVQKFDYYAFGPVLAVAPSGAAVLAWLTNEVEGDRYEPISYTLWVATRKPGGRFGDANEVYTTRRRGTNIVGPRPAVDSRGDMALLYGVRSDSKAERTGLYAVTGSLRNPAAHRHLVAKEPYWNGWPVGQSLTMDPHGRLRADWALAPANATYSSAGP